MNAAVKKVLERTLLTSGLSAIARRRRRHDALVLSYHNVVSRPSSAGDRSLHLAADQFARQLDAVADTHDVVPLASLLEPHSGDRPRAVITFDDAYVGCLSVALPEVVKRGLPATVFVAPGLLGGYTWWDRLANVEAGAVPEALRDRALDEFHGDGTTIMRAFSPAQSTVDPELRIGSEREVLQAAQLPGISIGSHTWSHANLASLTAAEIERELRTSMEWLMPRYQSWVPWLSYPYGRFSPDAERVAETLGYVGALRVDGGWWRRNDAASRYALPRFNVPAGVSIDGFRLRLSGIGA